LISAQKRDGKFVFRKTNSFSATHGNCDVKLEGQAAPIYSNTLDNPVRQDKPFIEKADSESAKIHTRCMKHS